jgi:hydroxyacylglutathione hydrolase
MDKTTLPLLFPLFFLLFPITCSDQHEFKVLHQLTGVGETNCYLLYDVQSKDAALIDVGGPIDTLIAAIDKNHLKLKYLFITHAHPDHIQGMPAVMKLFPDAKVSISREEYEDMRRLYSQWESTLDSEMVAEVKNNPEMLAMMNFDYNLIGEPDIFLEDNQSYKLGGLTIKTLLSPGHSRGSICFYLDKTLFSGDVLFYRTVGRTDLAESGGKEEMVKSVRRLYALFPDETIVYPGHDQFTDIGSEKRENKKITVDKVNM